MKMMKMKLFKNVYLQIPSSEYSPYDYVYDFSFICSWKSDTSGPKNHRKVEHSNSDDFQDTGI